MSVHSLSSFHIFTIVANSLWRTIITLFMNAMANRIFLKIKNQGAKICTKMDIFAFVYKIVPELF